MTTARDAAVDMGRVQTALQQARVYVAGVDQADSARHLASEIRHSPLRTALEHAESAAERVLHYLAEAAADGGPAGSRDGGPM